MLEYMIKNGTAKINSVPGLISTMTKQVSQTSVCAVCEDNQFEADVENDVMLEFETEKTKEYKLVQSSSSFKLDDVQGFTYGPITS